MFSHYRTPNLQIDAYDVVTNTPHVAAYRAPGATPTNFALESVMDEVGEVLGLDPLAFRLKNASRPGDPMPDGVQLPSVSLTDLLQRVQAHPCWTTPLAGPHQGRGIALGLWTMPGGTTSCHINLNADGSVTLVLGAVDLSATRTSLAMVAAEALELDLEEVRVVVGDTDMVAYSGASAGDKITYVTSKAILKASEDLLQRLKTRVAAALEAAPHDIVYERKRFWVQGSPERAMMLADIARRTVRGEDAVMGYGSNSETFSTVAIAPNAAVHVADVEVDSRHRRRHHSPVHDVSRRGPVRQSGSGRRPNAGRGHPGHWLGLCPRDMSLTTRGCSRTPTCSITVCPPAWTSHALPPMSSKSRLVITLTVFARSGRSPSCHLRRP